MRCWVHVVHGRFLCWLDGPVVGLAEVLRQDPCVWVLWVRQALSWGEVRVLYGQLLLRYRVTAG